MKFSDRFDIRVHLALLFVQITFGAFGVFGKYVMASIQPLALAGMRVAFAGPVLMLLAWRIEHCIPARKDLPMLALLGLLGVFTNQLLFIIGLNYTTAINAIILMPSIPVFTVAIAVLLRIEKLSMQKVAGITLSVIGALTILDLSSFSFQKSSALGNLLVLLNCMSYAGFIVVAKPVLQRLPPFTVIAWTFVFGGSAVFLISIPALASAPFATLTPGVWASIAYILLIPTLVNYVLNTWAIRRTTSSLVATYTTLQPVVATILAMILLNETLGVKEVAGFVLIILGLIVTSRA